MLTRPARDLVQLRLRQCQWENCHTAAMSQSGYAPVCLVALEDGQKSRQVGITSGSESLTAG